MGEVLLAGGPRDGRRITVADDASDVTVVSARPVPLTFPEPRPSWWRHPIRWFRWKPPPPPPPPELIQLAYRDTGRVSGGVRVFEIDGDWPWFKGPQAEGGGDLYRSLAAVFGAVHPMIRADQGTRWVMSLDWYKRVRALSAVRDPDDDPDEWEPDPHDVLLGAPVSVTDDGGVPHIENRRYPADF